MAVFRVERTKNYTVMSNYHLQDKRLSLKAKGLLSQMLSLPEDWDYTLSGLAHINKESKDAIRSAIRELEQAGYVQRRQTIDQSGKFSGNEYLIREKPVPSPSLEKPTTGSEATEREADSSAPPLWEEPLSVNPTTESTSSENPTQLNTKRQKTKKQNTLSQNTHSFRPPAAADTKAALADRRTDGQKEPEEIRMEILEQVSYPDIVTPENRALLDELVELMLEVALCRTPTIRLSRETEYPTGYVQERFRKLRFPHLQKVIAGICENTTRVRNTRTYLLTVLFNSLTTTDSYYTMRVNHDLYGEKQH